MPLPSPRNSRIAGFFQGGLFINLYFSPLRHGFFKSIKLGALVILNVCEFLSFLVFGKFFVAINSLSLKRRIRPFNSSLGMVKKNISLYLFSSKFPTATWGEVNWIGVSWVSFPLKNNNRTNTICSTSQNPVAPNPINAPPIFSMVGLEWYNVIMNSKNKKNIIRFLIPSI